MAAEEIWHYVEAKRDDGAPTSFKIRELEPRRELTRIFVVELPYPTSQMSRMPDAAAYRRLAEFEEQWLRPACIAAGWEFVGSKIEDGSFFLYMYGATDHGVLVERLSPFDAALGFYDDDDPTWSEYGTLHELLEQAKAMPMTPIEHGDGGAARHAARAEVHAETEPKPVPTTARIPKAKATPKAKRQARPAPKSKSKSKPKPKKKPASKSKRR